MEAKCAAPDLADARP